MQTKKVFDDVSPRLRPPDLEREVMELWREEGTFQKSLALRFARITRVRDDKSPAQATTLEELRALYERQFATKGRVVVPSPPKGG